MANTLDIITRLKGGEQVKGEMKKVTTSAKLMQGIFTKLGALLAVGVFAKGISSAIKAYSVQEQAVTRLNASLKAQNKFSEELSQSFQKQASALQKMTIFGDEAILAGQAFTLSMGISSKTVQKITPIVLDFASAMGIDLQTAFRIVGQAATGETGLLKRYGIIVDEAALKSEGLNAVLRVMENNFKGTAKAVAESGIGPLEQFKNLLGDFQEDIGRNIIPAINAMIKSYLSLSKALNKNMNLIRDSSDLLDNANITVEEHNFLLKKMKEGDLKAVEAFKLRVEKRLQGLEKMKSTEEDFDSFTEDKLKKAIKDEKERLEKVEKEREDAIAKEKSGIEDRYNFRRELREIDLQDTLLSIEKQIEAEEEGSEKRIALEQALSDFRKELHLETAADIAALQDGISSNLQSNITDMLLAEKSFGDGVNDIWKNLHRTIVDLIVKQVVEEKAAALIRLGVEKALAAAKSIAAYSGVPVVGLALGLAAAVAAKSEIDKAGKFHSGGVVPGRPGEEKVIIAQAGETITPRGASPGGGGVSLVVNISGAFIEGDETKWARMFRERIYPEMQRQLRKTGEQFSGS